MERVALQLVHIAREASFNPIGSGEWEIRARGEVEGHRSRHPIFVFVELSMLIYRSLTHHRHAAQVEFYRENTLGDLRSTMVRFYGVLPGKDANTFQRVDYLSTLRATMDQEEQTMYGAFKRELQVSP